jgi:hypothetical protein
MGIFADIREKLGELNLLKVKAGGELLAFLCFSYWPSEAGRGAEGGAEQLSSIETLVAFVDVR